MASLRTQVICILLCLLGLASIAHAAEVSASLLTTGPTPVPLQNPLVTQPGTTLTGAFAVHFSISGAVPKLNQNETKPSPDITFCTNLVLQSNGTLGCVTGGSTTITLPRGTNYSQGGVPPSDIPVTLTIASDVPCGVTYYVSERVGTNAGSGVDFSKNLISVDLPFSIQVQCPSSPGCTLSQGFWKNTPDAWPVNSLVLGSNASQPYPKADLIRILETPVGGNGLINLAYQLIAAKLNVANGASDAAIATTINAADTMIGSLRIPPIGAGWVSTDQTSSLVNTLTQFNEGTIGPGHCGN